MNGALAIILARAGSKGVPGKNIAPIGGRPCIEWSIDAAASASNVSRVVVSSDDPRALDVARSRGIHAIERPADLAHDTARIDDAARHAVLECERRGLLRVDERAPVVILYANVPVRPAGLVERAVALLTSTGCDSVQSYQPVGKNHPWWTARVDPATGVVAPWEGDVLNHGVFRRQDLPPAFIPDGAVIALTRRALMLEIKGVQPGPHAFFGLDRRGIVNPEGSVVDIDAPIDLMIAHAMLAERTRMKIGQTTIGPGKPYIIAEIGVNHDGDPARAVALTRLAAESGADAIKLQLFEASRLMSAASRLAVYQAAAGEHDPLAMLRRLELSIDDMRPCVDAAHALGMHAIVSVFSVELVEVAERLPWDAYKTASPDVIHRPLLETLARTGRPLIVSTGAATIEEIRRAVDWLNPWHESLALLQCVSSYPTPAEHAELGGILALRRSFPSLPIGYSDHTPDTATGAAAATLGAAVLEKHFTDDRRAKGPDHAASLDPAGFAEYCRLARGPATPPPSVEPVKRVLPIEGDVRSVSRQSIVPRRPLGRGTLLAREDLTFKRPGTGLAPFELDRVLGRRVLRDVASDVPLMKEDVDGFQS